MIKLPYYYQFGSLFNMATGRDLDIFGEMYGVKRKKFLFLKEPNWIYKDRIAKEALDKLGG